MAKIKVKCFVCKVEFEVERRGADGDPNKPWLALCNECATQVCPGEVRINVTRYKRVRGPTSK